MDKHHIIHTRKHWSTSAEARSLRNEPMLIATLDRDIHEAIHRYCPPVPLLGDYALRQTVQLFEPNSNSVVGTVDNLLFAIEESSRHPRAHQVERELCKLAIYALETQKGFIE